MTIIIAGTVYCPLCERQMRHTEIRFHSKQATLFFCSYCKIGIYDFDPAFNKWRDADKNIPCPKCGHDKIKWFARFMDGYFKGFCPKCKAWIEKDGDVKFKKTGAIVIPEEMEDENNAAPIDLKIPIAHLAGRLSKDKFAWLKNKFSRPKA